MFEKLFVFVWLFLSVTTASNNESTAKPKTPSNQNRRPISMLTAAFAAENEKLKQIQTSADRQSLEKPLLVSQDPQHTSNIKFNEGKPIPSKALPSDVQPTNITVDKNNSKKLKNKLDISQKDWNKDPCNYYDTRKNSNPPRNIPSGRLQFHDKPMLPSAIRSEQAATNKKKSLLTSAIRSEQAAANRKKSLLTSAIRGDQANTNRGKPIQNNTLDIEWGREKNNNLKLDIGTSEQSDNRVPKVSSSNTVREIRTNPTITPQVDTTSPIQIPDKIKTNELPYQRLKPTETSNSQFTLAKAATKSYSSDERNFKFSGDSDSGLSRSVPKGNVLQRTNNSPQASNYKPANLESLRTNQGIAGSPRRDSTTSEIAESPRRVRTTSAIAESPRRDRTTSEIAESPRRDRTLPVRLQGVREEIVLPVRLQGVREEIVLPVEL